MQTTGIKRPDVLATLQASVERGWLEHWPIGWLVRMAIELDALVPTPDTIAGRDLVVATGHARFGVARFDAEMASAVYGIDFRAWQEANDECV